LIQGEAGTDSFVVQRYLITGAKNTDRVRNNPNITLQVMRAIQRHSMQRRRDAWLDNSHRAHQIYRASRSTRRKSPA
jgi:hypothetical protein